MSTSQLWAAELSKDFTSEVEPELENTGCGRGHREKFKDTLVPIGFNFQLLSANGYAPVWNKYRLWVASS